MTDCNSTLCVNGTSFLSGNVGIGTTNPGTKLEVDGNIALTAGSGASITYADGTVQSTAWNGVLTGGDYAESVNVSGGRDKYEPGDVLVIDPATEGTSSSRLPLIPPLSQVSTPQDRALSAGGSAPPGRT
jgi:hypothetical protein